MRLSSGLGAVGEGGEMDETTAQVIQRLNDLEQELEIWKQRTAELDQRLHEAELTLKQLERPKMTNDEALQTFDVLKRNDPSLTLPSFAAQHGLSYNALRQARSRRRKKT
jgi:hypothetical protein